MSMGSEGARVSLAAGLLAGGLLVGCGGSAKKVAEPTAPPQLPLIAAHPLDFPEPSDVAIDVAGATLWMVGNHPERVYQLDLAGTLVRTLPYDGHDLEGIAFDPRDTTLWVTEENLREVVHLSRDGVELSRHSLGLTGEQNSGLEGICLDNGGRVFVLNEKHPGLFIALDSGLAIASEDSLDFANDYSGMAYHPARSCFWIVSDQSERLFLWSTSQHVVAEYLLPFRKPEGIAFDPVADRVYVVSDATNVLYVYRATP